MQMHFHKRKTALLDQNSKKNRLHLSVALFNSPKDRRIFKIKGFRLMEFPWLLQVQQIHNELGWKMRQEKYDIYNEA